MRLAKVCPAVVSRSVTLQPETKFVPLIKKDCAELEPGTGLGDTLVIDGVTFGEFTWNWYWPDEVPPGLMTSADQVCAAVVNVTLSWIWFDDCETIVRFVNVCPAVMSRSVTLHPDTKFDPLMKNDCDE